MIHTKTFVRQMRCSENRGEQNRCDQAASQVLHFEPMKRKERDEQLDAIFVRLEQLDVQDREIIRPSSAENPLIVTDAQLEAYGKRAEEKRHLIEKIRVIAGTQLED